MGIIICATHGQQGLALVSPALRSAFLANRRVPGDYIVAVRFSIMDEYPPSMRWLDSETVERLGIPRDRTLTLDDLDSIQPDVEPVCGTCFGEWLRLNDVQVSLSAEERRFLCLADQLQGLTWARLQPVFRGIAADIGKACHPTFIQSISSFGRTKDRLFSASLSFMASGNLQDKADLVVSASCPDRGTHLECESEIWFALPSSHVLDGPHDQVVVGPDDLPQVPSDRVIAWVTDVAAFATAHRRTIVEAMLAILGRT